MRNPDVANNNIRAWCIKLPDNLFPATLRQWVISGPFHPFWNWWIVNAATLEDIQGMPPAIKKYPGAEYEIAIIALHPDYPVNIDKIEDGSEYYHLYLEPIDFSIQFDGINKNYVIAILDLMVNTIIQGHASPDSDFRQYWESFVLSKIETLKKKEAAKNAHTGLTG